MCNREFCQLATCVWPSFAVVTSFLKMISQYRGGCPFSSSLCLSGLVLKSCNDKRRMLKYVALRQKEAL